MNGPEHYREAERLLGLIRQLPSLNPKSPSIVNDTRALLDGAAGLAAQAQVHATLALAAATAYAAVKDYTGDEDGSVSRGWAGVA